jgi:hypothetical protein
MNRTSALLLPKTEEKVFILSVSDKLKNFLKGLAMQSASSIHQLTNINQLR